MIKTLLVAVWAALASLAASQAAVYWKAHRAAPAAPEATHALEQRKTRILNVPIIAEGQVQGYVVAQFAYVGEAAALKTATVPPDAIILDEAFRLIYAEENIDFRKLQRGDIKKMIETIKTRVGERVRPELVKDILLQEFNFVAKEDVRK